ncbi:hypothetical protein V500_03243 [Pseudogymnoascus sp. VKM F-4518 (FW-2643)]|nr:hypothetical protein V500_03243 [Pseudogymnoascus sp. VKM F-4518 (FW-2643)]
MSPFKWCSQRAGGLSMVALLALCYHVISQEWTLERHGYKFEQPGKSGTSVSTLTFAYYSLLIHILVFLFFLRACWSAWDITWCLKQAAYTTAPEGFRNVSPHRHESSTLISSSETLVSDGHDYSSTTSEATDIEDKIFTDRADVAQRFLIHAIVIPNYNEELDTLKETLEVLASHPQARYSYDIYLGMEQREINGESKAKGIIKEFVQKFRSIDYTLHPADIPGEAAGKGSNMGWATRKLSAKYSMAVRKKVIVTGIDADSHLAPGYCANISSMHLSYPVTAATTLYAAPIIFDRNSHTVPAIVRVADILWCAAGTSGLYRGSAIAPPTSVYSLPLELIDRVGGWDCDAEAIGEDLHMYLKCFFALNGNLTCRTVLSPVSQSNVTGGGEGDIWGTAIDMQARYKQGLRHMWGILDTGFALRQAFKMWQDRKLTARSFVPLHWRQGNGYFPHNQLADDDPEHHREDGVFSVVTQDEPHWENTFYLFHRLFEAHFLPLHMTIMMLASALYVWVTNGTAEVNNLGWIFSLCNVLRMLGFMQGACCLFLYESFHQICVTTRERDMINAGLVDGMHFSHRSIKKNFIDYVLVPLVAPLYGAIPCAQANLSHFWTVKLVYAVSKKVTRQRAR